MPDSSKVNSQENPDFSLNCYRKRARAETGKAKQKDAQITEMGVWGESRRKKSERQDETKLQIDYPKEKEEADTKKWEIRGKI